METCEPLPLLWADAGLPLLVDDLVEPLVQEDGEALAAILRGWHIAGVVVGHLGDIIGDIGHMGMIGQPTLVIRELNVPCGKSREIRTARQDQRTVISQDYAEESR